LCTFDKALEHLDKYIAVEGPFDAVLGFSAGSVLGALYLAHTQRRGLSLPFKCGVFLASGNFADELKHAGLDVWSLENRIRLPSAHIWGSADTVAPKGGPELLRLFDPAQSHVLVHDGGHDVPKKEYVTEATNLIRRVVAMADD
jgi:pimeloyl-ACP methyl ester carboxylesterase